MTNTSKSVSKYDEWFWLSIVSLFFFQLLTDFVAAVYAFGLLGTAIPPEIAAVAVLLVPAVWLFVRRAPGKRGQLILLSVIALTSIVEIWLDTRGRLLVAGLGVGACLLWLPLWFFEHSRTTETGDYADLGLHVCLGLMLILMMKARPAYPPNAGVAAVVILMLIQSLRKWMRQPDQSARPIESAPTPFPVIVGLTLGLMAALIMLYFAFTTPNVIARWTDADYGLILVLIVLTVSVFVFTRQRLMRLPRAAILIGNAAFVIALTATLFAHHIDFPLNPGSYPLAEPLAPGWATVTLGLTCLLFPVILLDISLYSRELIARQPSLRMLGGSFTLAGLFLLLMIFAQIFTTVYDYIPVVGPLFRDRFWLVFAGLGVVMVLPVLLVRLPQPAPVERLSRDWLWGVPVFGAFTLLLAAWTPSFHAILPNTPHTLRVVTYNIQQGYDADGQLNYGGQLTRLEYANPDVIGLQESDTNRIAGGNFDLVRYFADKLGYHSFYGPKVGAGTFGLALLSRFPIENPRVVYFYSTGEQTAAIIATITAGDKRFQVIVTHLGNDGPIVQQQNLLQSIDPALPVIAMGDFNFRPDSAPYRLTRQTLDDAWLLRWPTGVDDQGWDFHDQIDHIFVSPGLKINDAAYRDSPDSDHPRFRVEIGW